MTIYKRLSSSLFLVMALAVTGCGGGTQSPSMPGVTGAMTSAPAASLPQDREGCQKSDGIDVLPCRISFDANHPGPSNVRVTSGGGDQRMLVEKDDCVLRGVATVTMRTPHEYSVAAGTASGSCSAHFTQKVHNNDGKGGGGSGLIINNRL